MKNKENLTTNAQENEGCPQYLGSQTSKEIQRSYNRLLLLLQTRTDDCHTASQRAGQD